MVFKSSLLYWIILLNSNFIFFCIYIFILILNYLNYIVVYNYNIILILLILIIVFYYTLTINNNKFIKILIYLNIIISFMFFVSNNFLNIFIFFELSLFPILLIIRIWGYQIERIQASSYLLSFTLFFSIPSFLVIIILQKDINLIYIFKINMFLVFILISIFLIKLPMFIFHIWLPKAHVESPTLGSILLAAILLKLGGWGVLIILLLLNTNFLYNLLIILGLGGCLFISFICIIQSDFKIIIAYSSVIHINLILIFIIIKTNFMQINVIIVIFLHAIISRIIFFMAGLNFYLIKRRLLYFIKYNSFNKYLFLLLIIGIFLNNFNPPPCLGVLPEIIIFVSFFKKSIILFRFFALILLFSSYFCVYIIINFIMGKKNINENKLIINNYNIINLFILLISLNLLFILIF